jgi:hypothetical protein
MRAIHLVGPDTAARLEPLCGSWGSLDADWTTVASEATCAACATGSRRLASEALIASEASLPRRLA